MFPASFAPYIIKLIAPKLTEKIANHVAKAFKLPQVLNYMELPNDADQRIDKLEAQIEMLAEDQHPPAIDLDEWKDIQLAIAPTPWEWMKNKNNFLLLSEASQAKIRNIISSIQYIKLCRFFELSSPEFINLNWVDNGLATWETLSKIYTD